MGLLLFFGVMLTIYGFLYLMVSRLYPRMDGVKFWAVCCILPALISVLLAFWAAAMEPPIPVNFDPMHDVNEGRWTYVILMAFGLVVPTFYIGVTTLIHLFLRLLVKRS